MPPPAFPPPIASSADAAPMESAALPTAPATSACTELCYWIYWHPWVIKSEDFPTLRMYAYASIWARLIYQGYSNYSAEADAESKFASEVTCSMEKDAQGRDVLKLTSPHNIPEVFKKGARILWSLTDPNVDAYYICMMTTHSKERRCMTVLQPDRCPPDFLQRTWRLDVNHDNHQSYRLLNALKTFTHPTFHSPIIQELVANEPQDAREVRARNHRQTSPQELAAVDSVCARHGLNGCQRAALLSRFFPAHFAHTRPSGGAKPKRLLPSLQ